MKRQIYSLGTISRIKISIGAAWVCGGILQVLRLPDSVISIILTVLIALMIWVMYCDIAKRVEKNDEMSIAHRQEANSLAFLAIAVVLGVVLLALSCVGMTNAGGLETMQVNGYDLQAILMCLIGAFYLIPEILFTLFEKESAEYAED